MCTTENNKENGTGSISRKIVWDKTKLDNFKLKLQDNFEAFNQPVTCNRAAILQNVTLANFEKYTTNI